MSPRPSRPRGSQKASSADGPSAWWPRGVLAAAGERHQEGGVSLLEGLVTQGPIVRAVEDLHWAAEPLLDLLDRILDDVAGPLLVLATARPGGPSLRAAGESVDLEPLSELEA